MQQKKNTLAAGNSKGAQNAGVNKIHCITSVLSPSSDRQGLFKARPVIALPLSQSPKITVVLLFWGCFGGNSGPSTCVNGKTTVFCRFVVFCVRESAKTCCELRKRARDSGLVSRAVAIVVLLFWGYFPGVTGCFGGEPCHS